MGVVMGREDEGRAVVGGVAGAVGEATVAMVGSATARQTLSTKSITPCPCVFLPDEERACSSMHPMHNRQLSGVYNSSI